jgi:hypothetical protein
VEAELAAQTKPLAAEGFFSVPLMHRVAGAKKTAVKTEVEANLATKFGKSTIGSPIVSGYGFGKSNLQQIRIRRSPEPSVGASMSLFREPDAGNLPVRFDERGQETEPSQTGLR